MGITTGEIVEYRKAEKGYSNYVENWSNAGGYGLWCNKACAERKDKEAAQKAAGAAANQLFNQQALASLNTPSAGGMSTGAILGITLGSLAGIGLLVFAIKKMRK